MSLEPGTLLLKGQTAIVTGAAAGLGRAIATGFARCGADVAVCDRDARKLAETAREIEACGRRAQLGVLDVRDEQAVGPFVGETVAALGRVHTLVNNAGGTFEAPFLELAGKGQDALVNENFTSVTHFVRAVVPHMRPSGASIVNLTSIEASRAAAVFLASPASRFVTGATLPVDGGSRAAGGWRRDGDGFVL